MGGQIRWSGKAGKALIIFFAAIGITSCCASKKLLTHTETVTIYNKVDSITYHDSTIYHTLYKEYYKDYADLLDTLKLETSYSEFKSYIDTTAKVLKGSATNKTKDIPVEIKWKEKIVYRDIFSGCPGITEKQAKAFMRGMTKRKGNLYYSN